MAKANKTPPAAPAPEGPPEIQVVFVGTGEIERSGKTGILVMTLATYENVKGQILGQVQAAASLFEVKAADRPRIAGNVYTTHGTVDDDGKLKRCVPKFKWSGQDTPVDDDTRLEMQAQMKALDITLRARKLQADEAKVDLIAKAMRPIWRVYMQTDGMGKAALETLVLRALKSGKAD